MSTQRKKFLFFLLFFLLIAVCGCKSVVTIDHAGASGRKNYENIFLFNGGLSAETVNVLGNHLLQEKMENSPEIFIRELANIYKNDPSERILTAIVETSQMIASTMKDSPDQAVKYNLTTLLYTSRYIRQVTEKNSTRLFDPEAIITVRCHNLALAELFSYLYHRNLHCASGFELSTAGGEKLHFNTPLFKMPVAVQQISSFLLCSDFRPRNLTHNSRRFGLGVPLICELQNGAIPDTVFAEDQVIPATLLIKFDPADNDPSRKNVSLVYLDSRSIDDIAVKDFQLPLAQDFSTPLAYMVRKPQVFNFLQRTFQIEKTRNLEGLYHLEPHNDNRIPIILVHGLMSDIRTWLQLINTLQSDPELRKNYRFMGFSYSSGNPIFVSAMHLRQALKKEREKLAAEKRDLTKFDRMILIGHSMGGLLSRLMISHSDDKLLSSFIGEKNYYQSVDYKNESFRKLMIFDPVPSVKRVIFIAVPHKGSALAQSLIGKIGSSMIKIPKSLLDFNTRLVKQLINLRDNDRQMIIKRFNGIDNLSPDGTALRMLNRLPVADIPFHSVIGNNKAGGIPGGSDGVVPYSSSHLDKAKSEVVVKSGHSVQQNPLAIQEIKRILKLHLQEKD